MPWAQTCNKPRTEKDIQQESRQLKKKATVYRVPVSLVRPVLRLRRVCPRLGHLLPAVGVRVQDEKVDGRLHFVVVPRAVAAEAVNSIT